MDEEENSDDKSSNQSLFTFLDSLPFAFCSFHFHPVYALPMFQADFGNFGSVFMCFINVWSFNLGSPFVIPFTRDVNRVVLNQVHENSDADSTSPPSILCAISSEDDICCNISSIWSWRVFWEKGRLRLGSSFSSSALYDTRRLELLNSKASRMLAPYPEIIKYKQIYTHKMLTYSTTDFGGTEFSGCGKIHSNVKSFQTPEHWS